MRLPTRGDDHAWTQLHLSHYVEDDLSWRARRRVELHAEECPDCGRGICALRALLRLMHGVADWPPMEAPAAMFALVRADAGQPRTGADQADGA